MQLGCSKDTPGQSKPPEEAQDNFPKAIDFTLSDVPGEFASMLRNLKGWNCAAILGYRIESFKLHHKVVPLHAEEFFTPSLIPAEESP